MEPVHEAAATVSEDLQALRQEAHEIRLALKAIADILKETTDAIRMVSRKLP